MAKKKGVLWEPERVYKIRIPLSRMGRVEAPDCVFRDPENSKRPIDLDDPNLAVFPEQGEIGDCYETITTAYSGKQAFTRHLNRHELSRVDMAAAMDTLFPDIQVIEEEARPQHMRPRPKKKRKPEQDRFLVRIPFHYRGNYGLEPDYETWFVPTDGAERTPQQTALYRVLMGALGKSYSRAMQVYNGTSGPDGKFLKKYPWVKALEHGMKQGMLF